MTDTHVKPRGGRMRMPRSRGAASGLLLILLGAWGALIPFIGPMFDFAFSPDQAWAWTTGRGWLLPARPVWPAARDKDAAPGCRAASCDGGMMVPCAHGPRVWFGWRVQG